MTRILTVLNFFGVVAVAILCAAQWGQNAGLSRRIEHLTRANADQQSKLDDDEKTIKENASDMDDFRNRLAAGDAALKDVQDKLAKAQADESRLTADNARLTSDNAQLTAALGKWQAGVAARDQALKDAADRIAKLQDDRNDAVNKFNDLANKYNAAVAQLNAAAK
jgi:chromosome segregation ATPase